MKTLKIALALLLALCMVLPFAACGKKPATDPEKKDPTTEPTSEPTAEPTSEPTSQPTSEPTSEPTAEPTAEPTEEPEPEYYYPSLNGFATGITYTWDIEDISMDFASDSGLWVSKTADLSEDVKNAIAGKDGFGENVVIGEWGGMHAFDIAGFDGEKIEGFFTAGYTYTFKFNLYAENAPGKIYLIAYDGTAGNHIVAEDLFKAGMNTLDFDYEVLANHTGLTIFATEGAKFYIGDMSVKLTKSGPTINKLTKGYQFNLADVKFDNQPELITVADITDTDVKDALLTAGHAETDPILHATQAPTVFQNLTGVDMLVPKYKYTFEIEMYGKGGGGYLIALNNIGNTTFLNNVVSTGYQTKTYEYEVGAAARGDSAVTFYNWPEVYIASFKLTLQKPDTTSEKVYADPTFKAPTAAEMEAGYTFDFALNNVPNLGTGKYVNITELPEVGEYGEMKAFMTAANGFKDYTFRVTGDHQFQFTLDNLTVDKTYEITINAYWNTETVGTKGGLILQMGGASAASGGAQNGEPDTFTVTAGEGKLATHTITTTIRTGTNMLLLYHNGSYDFYITSLTIKEVVPAT